MTEDLKAVYETIDSLQVRGDYEEIQQIAQYAIDAILNDRIPANFRFGPEGEALHEQG